jgi:hypothetical protein
MAAARGVIIPVLHSQKTVVVNVLAYEAQVLLLRQ